MLFTMMISGVAALIRQRQGRGVFVKANLLLFVRLAPNIAARPIISNLNTHAATNE
jgi:hypothetical protein